jgi:hypothetical protein
MGLDEGVDGVREMRRDLRNLVALEWAQTALGFGLLGAVAIHAAVVAEDLHVRTALALASALAVASLALAFRVRMGHAALRRGLQELEIRHELESQMPLELTYGAPYRDGRGLRTGGFPRAAVEHGYDGARAATRHMAPAARPPGVGGGRR